MPFGNVYHGPGAPQPADLATRIEMELRARIEDAVDYACLDAMVRDRRARGASLPSADDPGDREEYAARVRAFLEALRVAIVADLTVAQRTRLGPTIQPAGAGPEVVLRAHVALARELPDYWQRFEAFRVREHPGRPGSEASGERSIGAGPSGPKRSGGDGRGLLDRLLRRP